MIEIHVMANGWLVSSGRNLARDVHYPTMNEECFVFTSWEKLVFHIKKELNLSGPAPAEKDRNCKS